MSPRTLSSCSRVIDVMKEPSFDTALYGGLTMPVSIGMVNRICRPQKTICNRTVRAEPVYSTIMVPVPNMLPLFEGITKSVIATLKRSVAVEERLSTFVRMASRIVGSRLLLVLPCSRNDWRALLVVKVAEPVSDTPKKVAPVTAIRRLADIPATSIVTVPTRAGQPDGSTFAGNVPVA